MIKKTFGELSGLLQGASLTTIDAAAAAFEGVSTDSRRIEAGRLFVPLQGDNFDGHDYAREAWERGAAGVLWQADHPVPEQFAGWPLVLVPDTLAALQQLAAAYRRELPVKVIGITGSNGKTTTKDMVAAVLATVFRVHKTAGNLNNHIGLPLTILEMAADTEAAVLEMGMSGFGEIELLSQIAQPDAAIITNIGDAHLLQLGSREGIAKAKLEIASGLKSGGLLVFNGDEPLLHEGIVRLQGMASFEALSFGVQAGNDWRAEGIRVTADSSSFSLRCGDASLDEALSGLHIPVPGSHNVTNASAAIAAGVRLGVPVSRIAGALSSLRISGMRIEAVRAANGAVVLNDAYNANPTAVRAAVDLVEQLKGFHTKWLVLGDMLELGPEEAELHRQIGAYIHQGKADRLLTLGPQSERTAEGAAEALGVGSVRHFADKAGLIALLQAELRPDDLVLVKGSRGMKMEQIVHALEQGIGG
ncbi:UDP-N-acetylmuramoyl-tripeptide--D-alanyl-D-alanine ligase [Paenibacillus pinihumi]|uniref:UDP-N-acetylmuramoyl-tripeptide--D-alanyl-D- alanine ligase n=1 Tax=Paenibacillus pinihumi TaxID=669462 RepID=UPI00041DCCF8|nr:UDP-N-acetylmuramoyl-tripeptide--D-alanyl-D-alanine ligase [Paenibacillus pinihumi]